MTCKGICTRYRAEKPGRVSSRYGDGQKRCSICGIYLAWDGPRCPCCGYVLRTKPKDSDTREKLRVRQQIKRM